MLWPDFLADLQDPGLIWQCSTLLLCMLVGWGLSRLLIAMFVTSSEKLGVLRAPVGSFLNVLSPLLSALLIALAIPVLGRWQHTGLLRIALPLFFSFSIRLSSRRRSKGERLRAVADEAAQPGRLLNARRHRVCVNGDNVKLCERPAGEHEEDAARGGVEGFGAVGEVDVEALADGAVARGPWRR